MGRTPVRGRNGPTDMARLLCSHRRYPWVDNMQSTAQLSLHHFAITFNTGKAFSYILIQLCFSHLLHSPPGASHSLFYLQIEKHMREAMLKPRPEMGWTLCLVLDNSSAVHLGMCVKGINRESSYNHQVKLPFPLHGRNSSVQGHVG